MLEKVIIVVVVAVVVLAAGVAWWFENGPASHNEGGHAADVDSDELTKLESKPESLGESCRRDICRKSALKNPGRGW